jgi:hypothetical protein
MNAIWKKAVVAECDDIVAVGSSACSRSLLPGAEQVTDRVVFWHGAQAVA